MQRNGVKPRFFLTKGKNSVLTDIINLHNQLLPRIPEVIVAALIMSGLFLCVDKYVMNDYGMLGVFVVFCFWVSFKKFLIAFLKNK